MNKSGKNLTEKKELKLSNKKEITEWDSPSIKLRKHALGLGLQEGLVKNLNKQAEERVLDLLKDNNKNKIPVEVNLAEVH